MVRYKKGQVFVETASTDTTEARYYLTVTELEPHGFHYALRRQEIYKPPLADESISFFDMQSADGVDGLGPHWKLYKDVRKRNLPDWF